VRGDELNDKECVRREEVFVDCYGFVNGFEFFFIFFISALLLALQAH